MRRPRNSLPKHCSWNRDRAGGRLRVRFRKRGFSTYLPSPASADFAAAYARALEGVKAQASNAGAERTKPGTVRSLVVAYLDSPPFKAAAAETRRGRRNFLERFSEAHGDKPLVRADAGGRRTMLLTRAHVQAIVDEKAATPHAQRNFLNTLRALFAWAAREGRVPENPVLGVTRVKARSRGYRTWTENEIARFEAAHPVGGKARLAFALLLYTGQRRSDVVRMGCQHVRDGVLTVDQRKTEAHLEIPVHPRLQEVIDATPTLGVHTFLVTHVGKPYTSAGFGNWFREQCDAAGCAGVSAHGLRMACARRLAEIGCTAHQIAAITGHASLSEVQRYTRAADQKRMAKEAMAKLNEGGW